MRLWKKIFGRRTQTEQSTKVRGGKGLWVAGAQAKGFDPVLSTLTGGWIPLPVQIRGMQTVLCFSDQSSVMEAIRRVGGNAPAPVVPKRVPERNLHRILKLTDQLMRQRTGTGLDLALGDPVFDDGGTLVEENWTIYPDDWGKA